MTIIIKNNENIRTIILNRPEKLNSVNLKMATELNQAVIMKLTINLSNA